MQMLIHILVSAALLFMVGKLVDGIEIRDGKAAIFGAAMLGVANAVVKPILLFFAFPITMITLGLFVMFVNALMIMLAAQFVDGFEVEGLGAAMWGAFWLWILNFGVSMLFGI
jgi:putative membrane protein